MSWLLLAVLAVSARDVKEEQAQVQERLEAERAAFETLQSEKADVVVLLDVFERQARSAAEATARLDSLVKAVKGQLTVSRAEAEKISADIAARQRAMSPRLVALYRLTRKSKLSTWVSAAGFAELMRKERSMRTLLTRELDELKQVQRLDAYLDVQTARLDALEQQGGQLAAALKIEQALAQGRRARFDDLVRTLTAEANQKSRIVKDLERAEAELSNLVGEMQSTGDFGFRSRKGQLPFPASGLVEVGFGKVVNPRFNTVTVQKGIDIRAPEGSRVFCVAEGTVVYSGWLKGYGNMVIVDHGSGYHSLYAHLQSRLVDVDNELEEGEELGSVGDTGSLKGAYLYFEIRKGGEAIDPLPWLQPSEQ